MARRLSSPIISPLFSVFISRGDTRLYLIAAIYVVSVLLHHLSLASASHHRHFEGFDADESDEFFDQNDASISEIDLSPPPTTTLSVSDPVESHDGPPIPQPDIVATSQSSDQKPSSTSFDYWDEDEFEGIPQNLHSESPSETSPSSDSDPNLKVVTEAEAPVNKSPKSLSSYTVEAVCVSFLVVFVINYFTGKRENENIALAWATKFATKDSIFEKNFSLLGVGETEDSPLLLKEGQNVFKFYASGRRYCQGLLATMELKSRHDLISRLYNMVVPCKDEITLEVYMNDDAMDAVVFAVARKKLAKTMQKEVRDLQRFAGVITPPGGRKWLVEELAVVSESKEVAGDMIPEVVLEQVFGEKAFEKFGKGFISMHFSDQHIGSHKKMLVFKFALSNATDMSDMTRLIALVPYYIDLIGKYKLSSHARSKADAARLKVAQEFYKELQNARQEALLRKKAEQKKKLEEGEAKLSAEALRRKEAKDRARQLKKGMPKMKMTRAH
ncbi:unnamed protein product [Cuscuta europaea]|uniref:Coiled-coil domain-containing protein 47 n=1 Tax=Cuscuta europaea TaxID=41803 RepID=A0A9P1DY06_CUSEU|nr:unnamed protein product [Cuscuta europaea]